MLTAVGAFRFANGRLNGVPGLLGGGGWRQAGAAASQTMRRML